MNVVSVCACVCVCRLALSPVVDEGWKRWKTYIMSFFTTRRTTCTGSVVVRNEKTRHNNGDEYGRLFMRGYLLIIDGCVRLFVNDIYTGYQKAFYSPFKIRTIFCINLHFSATTFFLWTFVTFYKNRQNSELFRTYTLWKDLLLCFFFFGY